MYNFAHLILPSRIYPKYLLALLYEKERDTAGAIRMARNILNTPVHEGDRLGGNIEREMNDLLIKWRVSAYDPYDLINKRQKLVPSFNN